MLPEQVQVKRKCQRGLTRTWRVRGACRMGALRPRRAGRPEPDQTDGRTGDGQAWKEAEPGSAVPAKGRLTTADPARARFVAGAGFVRARPGGGGQPGTVRRQAGMPTSPGPVLVIGHPPPQSTLQSLLHTIYRYADRQPTYHMSLLVLTPSLDFQKPRAVPGAAISRSLLSAWSRRLAARPARRWSQRSPYRLARSARRRGRGTCSAWRIALGAALWGRVERLMCHCFRVRLLCR